MLPLRPNVEYDSWLSLTVKVAMPMLFHVRKSLGFSTNVCTNPAGEWLRASLVIGLNRLSSLLVEDALPGIQSATCSTSARWSVRRRL